jgi:hypothetical protein
MALLMDPNVKPLSQFLIRNCHWFVPRFIDEFTEWLLQCPWFHAHHAANIVTGVVRMDTITTTVVHITKTYLEELPLFVQCSRVMLERAAEVTSSMAGGTGRPLHELSDIAGEGGLLHTRAMRARAYKLHPKFDERSMGEVGYRLLEVAIAGCISCLQEDFIRGWLFMHRSRLEGKQLGQMVSICSLLLIIHPHVIPYYMFH